MVCFDAWFIKKILLQIKLFKKNLMIWYYINLLILHDIIISEGFFSRDKKIRCLNGRQPPNLPKNTNCTHSMYEKLEYGH